MVILKDMTEEQITQRKEVMRNKKKSKEQQRFQDVLNAEKLRLERHKQKQVKLLDRREERKRLAEEARLAAEEAKAELEAS